MFMFNRRVSPVLLTAGYLAAASAIADTPDLGVAASTEQIGAVEITVFPDGGGLPPGAGTATEGAELYQRQCMACHGQGGQGGINDRLAGGQGSLTTHNPVKTVSSYWPYATTVFDYVRRAMPYQAPGSLSDDEVYALTAYLLYVNDIIDERAEMNASTLPTVSMPNHGNFRWAYESK